MTAPTTTATTTAGTPLTAAGPRGRFTFRPVDPAMDAALLHSWTATPRARFWGLETATEQQVRTEHERIAADPHQRALVALDARHEDRPAFLLETYDPAHSVLAGRYPFRHGDAGLHLLLPDPADGGGPEHGFSLAAMEAALDHVFADPAVLRVVVEPDARNTAIQALNARCGFRPAERLDLPGADGAPAKTAQLSYCTRVDFATTTGRPSGAVPHLSPQRWAAANRHVTAKAIAEFTHERLLSPTPESGSESGIESGPGSGEGGWWVLPGPGVRYRFRARRYALDHWEIDADSLTCEEQGGADEQAGAPWREAAPDAQRFVTTFREHLGVSDQQLPVYLEEIGSTLASHCYKQLHSTATAAELADGTGDTVADFQRLEAAMTEGHPCFVANNGRIGLGAEDYTDLAPETGSA
ncbi:MAG TPA: GNAT family N-acetyltransferase, partial [Citricoccus sp.]